MKGALEMLQLVPSVAPSEKLSVPAVRPGIVV